MRQCRRLLLASASRLDAKLEPLADIRQRRDRSTEPETLRGSVLQLAHRDARYMDYSKQALHHIAAFEDDAEGLNLCIGASKLGDMITKQLCWFHKGYAYDAANRQRFDKGARDGWGAVLPILAQFRHIDVEDVRRGRVVNSLGGLHTKLLDTQVPLTSRDRGHYTDENLQRQFAFEVYQHAYSLRKSMRATATLELTGVFCGLCHELRFTVPSSGDVAVALAATSDTPAHHATRTPTVSAAQLQERRGLLLDVLGHGRALLEAREAQIASSDARTARRLKASTEQALGCMVAFADANAEAVEDTALIGFFERRVQRLEGGKETPTLA